MKKPKPLPKWEADALAVRQCVYHRTPVDTDVLLKVLDDLRRRARKADAAPKPKGERVWVVASLYDNGYASNRIYTHKRDAKDDALARMGFPVRRATLILDPARRTK